MVAESKLKLTYFPLKGRAEPIRLTLVAGGIEFEDERINFEEFGKRKATGEFPFSALPVMNVGGKSYAQTGTLIRYAGQLAGLYPKSVEKMLLVDMVSETADDIMAPFSKGKTPELRKSAVEAVVPRYGAALDKIYATEEGPFLLGETMTTADIVIATLLEIFQSGFFDHVPTDCLDHLSNLIACQKAVFANEKIAAWRTEHDM